jgi:predicted porin
MQKKLIALAVAGLASTAAFAQTNVTIYGIVDYGYSYRFDDRGLNATNNTISNANGPSSSSRLDSGIQSGNRLGFKGTEDLGNGLKAVFLLEQGFNLDTGTQGGGGDQMFNRQAYAGLSGNFGTAVGGRLYTPYYTMMLQYDPFANGTMGAYSNVWAPAANSSGGTTTLLNPLRVDNAVAYISPSFGGFTLTGAYANNAIGADSTSNNSENNTVYAIKGDFVAGGFTAGANYHAIQAGTQLAAVEDVQNFTLGLGYDFKFMKLTGVYTWTEADFSAAGVDSVTLNNYLLGASAPFGKWTVKGSYIYSDGDSSNDAQQVALGVDYSLSKRTNFYSAYSWIDNSGVRMNGVGDGSNSGAYSAGNGYVAGAWQQGFQVGLRHMF